MKEFVEKYMCPSLNIHLASYCKGRKKPCVRCDSLDTERKTWSFTKCVPNKQLIYDRRGVTDIREVCAKGSFYNIYHMHHMRCSFQKYSQKCSKSVKIKIELKSKFHFLSREI